VPHYLNVSRLSGCVKGTRIASLSEPCRLSVVRIHSSTIQCTAIRRWPYFFQGIPDSRFQVANVKSDLFGGRVLTAAALLDWERGAKSPRQSCFLLSTCGRGP
jgi:hypothetical protein